MSKVHFLTSVQKIPRPLAATWDFFSDPHNLLTLTPPFLNLKVTNEIYGREVYAGQIITYKVRPFRGVALAWMTEITHLDKGVMFVDEQRKGPYRLWHHQHHFRQVDGGTEMTDIVHYRLPFGIFGDWVHPIVKKKLTGIFSYRFDRINELFGAWPGQELQLGAG